MPACPEKYGTSCKNTGRRFSPSTHRRKAHVIIMEEGQITTKDSYEASVEGRERGEDFCSGFRISKDCSTEEHHKNTGKIGLGYYKRLPSFWRSNCFQR